MRILIINQPFWPDVVATAQHMADWSTWLAEQGHEVSVIASHSVYGKKGANLSKRENYKGVHIHRVGANLFRKGRFLTRLVDFGLFHLAALFRALTLPRQDVVVCLTTPPMIGVVGMLLKLLRGSRYVQYEMDVYPEVAIALGRMRQGSLANRLFARIHRRVLRSADRIVVLGRCMHRLIAGQGVPEHKLVQVTPWADPLEIKPLPRADNPFRRELGLQDHFIVMYSGNLGLGHDITTLCGAMRKLHQGHEDRIRFVFIGGGARMQEVRKACDQNGVPCPVILEYQPRERLSETLSAADLHLITQAPGTTGLIVPSKLYGILAAGRPALYVGPQDTEVALTLQQWNLGTTLSIGDEAGFVEAIRYWHSQAADLSAFEARARQVMADHYSRAVCCRTLTAMVESLGQHPLPQRQPQVKG